MAGVTPEQTAAAVKVAVLELGGAFSQDPKTMRKARQLGLTGWAFYVAGRAGALGDVRADTAAGAVGVLAPEARRVLGEADPAARPLFAAWRAMPIPEDSRGARAAVLLHLLREHRGGAHL